MGITLAQAVPLKPIIERRIAELVRDRDNVSTVTFEKGEEYERPDRTVEEVTEAIAKAREDLRTLMVLTNDANLRNTVEWDGKELPILEALELAKQLRQEVGALKGFGNRNKTQRGSTDRFAVLHGQSATSITQTMYEPREYKAMAEKLERQVNRLSQVIERANHFVEIEFNDSDYVG